MLCLMTSIAIIAGCPRPSTNTTSGCESDTDCGPAQRCDVNSGICLCAQDEACDVNEFCNQLGRCQPVLGCVNNDDCRREDGTTNICDVNTGTCVELNAASFQCVVDSQCPYGAVCAGNICTSGCHDSGDCILGQPCINGQCDPRPGACDSNFFCQNGQFCNVSTTTCQTHRNVNTLCRDCRPKLCFSNQECTGGATCVGTDGFFTPGQCDSCAGGPCLLDSSISPNNCSNDNQCASLADGAYCGKQPCFVDTDCAVGACQGADLFAGVIGECSQGTCTRTFCGNASCNDQNDLCPKGYNCSQLITVDPRQSCTVGDNTCQGGRQCSAGGENNVAGFCSCLTDADCPDGTTCVNGGPNGFCLQGTTCGPANGLLCEDVLP